MQDYQAIVGEVWRAYNIDKEEGVLGKNAAEGKLRGAIRQRSLVLELTDAAELDLAVESEVVRVQDLVDPNNPARIQRR